MNSKQNNKLSLVCLATSARGMGEPTVKRDENGAVLLCDGAGVVVAEIWKSGRLVIRQECEDSLRVALKACQ